MVIAQPVDTEQLDSDVSGGAYSPLRIIPATLPAVCRQSGCREAVTGDLDLCAGHQAAQDRLRETVLATGHLTSAELRDLRTHRP